MIFTVTITVLMALTTNDKLSKEDKDVLMF